MLSAILGGLTLPFVASVTLVTVDRFLISGSSLPGVSSGDPGQRVEVCPLQMVLGLLLPKNQAYHGSRPILLNFWVHIMCIYLSSKT